MDTTTAMPSSELPTTVAREQQPMALTDTQKTLIEQSWKVVEEEVGLQEAGILLFKRLAADHPSGTNFSMMQNRNVQSTMLVCVLLYWLTLNLNPPLFCTLASNIMQSRVQLNSVCILYIYDCVILCFRCTVAKLQDI